MQKNSWSTPKTLFFLLLYFVVATGFVIWYIIAPKNIISRTVTESKFTGWMKTHTEKLDWEYRWHTNKLNRNVLANSLKVGRQFMLNNQKKAGNFNYQYDFVNKEQDKNDSQVRQAGALWGMALIYQYEQTNETRKALDKSFNFFFTHTRKGATKGAMIVHYPSERTSKTGTVALVALAIIDFLRTIDDNQISLEPEYRKKLKAYLDGYLKHLAYMYLPNKHFSQSYNLRTKSKTSTFSPYFDGETILCLIKAAKYLGYQELIPLIENSAMPLAKHYTVDQWLKDPDSNKTKGFFQWSCMAFWEYQDAGWKDADFFGDYVLSLAWWMVYTHHTLWRTRNTAYAYEGIIHAYRIAKKRGLKDALRDLTYTIDEGLYKLTSWQVGGPLDFANNFLSSNPTDDRLAIGGIMNHRREPRLRIDVTQHQMHAVILALRHVFNE